MSLCVLAVTFAALSLPNQTLADDQPKRVLILFGDDLNHPSYSTISQSLRSSLKSSSTRVELYPEYLDRRVQFREYESEFLALMHRKYDGRKLDLIIAVGRPALEVLLPHGSKLFPNTPAVFATLDKSDLDGLNLRPDVTGVWDEVNIQANLDLALELYPKTRRVIVVGGISPFDKHWMDRARQDFKPYEGKLEFQYLLGLTAPELEQRLSSLPADSIIVFISDYLDRGGNYYLGAEVLERLAPAANRPIFIQGEIQLGSGAVGGRLLSMTALGAELARVSSRILAGEAPRNIPSHGVPTVPMFDARAVERWGISESKLPAGSIVLNRTPTLWELYRWYIITIIVAASLQLVLIVFLLVANAKRKRVIGELRQAKDELRLIADSLPVLVSQIDTNGHYTFNNLAYEHWFGQPRDQITGRHMRDVLGESVWQTIRPHVERALKGHDQFYEDHLAYTSGPARWVKVSEVPVRDQSGKIKGAVSLVSDITESRRAQEVLRDLSSRLIKAQEEERSRVARELHDDLSQKVALLSIELEYAETHMANRDLDLTPTIQKARSDAEDISDDIHRISHRLHPSRLDHLGLVKSVKAFLQEISTLHDLKIDFRTEGFPAALPKDVTLCVFRIIQESLRNVIKHSGAHEAEVVLELLPTELRASISDQGCGFDTNSERMTSGLGLIGMSERLRLVGGRIAIWSAPQKGTRVEVCVPLSDSKPAVEAADETRQSTLTVAALSDEVRLSG